MTRATRPPRHERSGFWQRWGPVVACAGLMTISSGVWYTASVFFLALIQEFGWDYASTASIFSLFTVLYGVWGILVGHLVDRYGARRVVLAGGLFLPLAMAANGLAQSPWHLYLSHGVLVALGLSATGYVPVSLVLTRRFREHRGLALGTASAGVGVGILLLVSLAQVVIGHWGWRIAYLALAAISASVALPVAFFALNERGLAPLEAGRLSSSAAAPAPGPSGGRDWWPEWIYLAGAGCVIAAILALLAIHPASSPWSLYGYAVLMGLGYAVSPAMTPILSGRFFVGRHFGIILGALNTFYQSAGAAGMWVAGYAHDLTGSYRLPLLGAILSAADAVACVWVAAPRRYPPGSSAPSAD